MWSRLFFLPFWYDHLVYEPWCKIRSPCLYNSTTSFLCHATIFLLGLLFWSFFCFCSADKTALSFWEKSLFYLFLVVYVTFFVLRSLLLVSCILPISFSIPYQLCFYLSSLSHLCIGKVKSMGDFASLPFTFFLYFLLITPLLSSMAKKVAFEAIYILKRWIYKWIYLSSDLFVYKDLHYFPLFSFDTLARMCGGRVPQNTYFFEWIITYHGDMLDEYKL